MEKMVLLLIILSLGIGPVAAQQDKSAAKEARKEQRAAARAAEEAAEYALFEQAFQALNDHDFVLEADRVEFKDGSFEYVNSNTNFVSLDADQATIQLAFNGVMEGWNGLGGITVDGTASNIVMKTDKQGLVSFSMNVQGIAVSAIVTFRMAKGTNRCTATVTPNFSGNRVSFTGYLYPRSEASVFKGRSI